jgi:LPS-assembly protein
LLKLHLLTLIFLALFALPLWAQTPQPEQSALIQGINIRADSMDRDTQNETIDLEGQVQIVYQDQHLSCKKAHINLRAKTIDASGDVLLTTPKANLAGQRVILDYETNTGLIIDGYVQSGNVLFEGSIIRKLSDVDYVADDAVYTTCTTCPEAWSFSGSKIRAEIGGYAYIKNSVMRFASVPVFWFPYLAVPLKTDRQSGLLTPSFGIRGKGGLTYSQSYFWAISRSTDATLNLTNYEFRGLKTLGNYRYVLSENSSGELDVGYLNDHVFKDDSRLNLFRISNYKSEAEGNRNPRPEISRWFIKYNHYYEMPDGFVQRSQLNTASDLQYPSDFPLETQNNGDSSMESRVSVTKNTNAQHFSVDASIYQNLLQSDPLGGNEFAVHRLPELRFSQAMTRLGSSDFLASMDITYQNFARPGFGWDDVTFHDKDPDGNGPGAPNQVRDGDEPLVIDSNCRKPDWEKDPDCHPIHDGAFNSKTDLIRTGQRLTIFPKLSYPIRLQNLEIVPSVGYNETQYYFPASGPDESNLNIRRYLRTDVTAKTTFSRIYGDFSSLQSERIKHEVQPELQYTAIPWVHHPSHQFFGLDNEEDTPYLSDGYFVTDSNFANPGSLHFDYNDRLYDRKLATLALTNKLTRKNWADGSPTYQQFLTWRLTQTYDLYQSERDPDSQTPNLTSSVDINLNSLRIVQTSIYHFFQEVSDTNVRVRVTNSLGDFFQVEQSLFYNIIATEKRTGDRRESYIVSAKKSISWLDLIGRLGYNAQPADYLTFWGYGAQVRLPGDCLYIGLSHFRATSKEPEYEISVNFAWDGSSRPPLSEAILDSFTR